MTSSTEKPKLAIGIDVGATKIAGALVDRKGKVYAERRAPTLVHQGPTAVIQRIADLVRELREDSFHEIAGIGIGSPGYVNPHAGVVAYAVNMDWHDVDVVAELRNCLDNDSEIFAENDANVMALGEYTYGAAKGRSNFVYVSIGTGLGSGIIVDGHLVHGNDFRAAELGHLSLDVEGRRCACGLRGCVETVVSGPGILLTARELLATGMASYLQQSDELTPETVLRAAIDEQDALALAVFEHTASWLGQALAVCIALLNPSCFVLGGGMGLAAFDLLVSGMNRELERRVIAESFANLDILRSQVYSSAVGASSLVWYAGN